MNPTVSAMRRPITTLMVVVALIASGALALQRMQVDIFPSLNSPRIYVFLQYGGMSPRQMEGFVVCQFELLFQYVDGIKEIKSRSIQQIALVELSFYPGIDMGQAMAQVVAMANRAVSRMPPGTLPPMVMRLDVGSVPVGYLVLEGKTTPIGMVADVAQNIIRPLVLQNVPGTVAVSPFGPNVRSILVKCDPEKLQTYNLAPHDVTNALMSGNVVVPAGNLYIKDSMPLVPNNATVHDAQDLGKIPLRLGENVYIRDVADIEDVTDLDYGYALVNGKNSVFLPIIKKSTASTLSVVADIRKSMELFRSVVPKDVTVTFEFDESPTVLATVESVATEGFIGAALTGLMILIFLRDLRSVVVVVLNIPLALMGSLFGLWVTGNTINIMSLGGMALAIGMLVDEATVSIENIHVQMDATPHLARAVERGSLQTAVPRLLAMLCILSVFIPAFIMQDPLRSLFMPLVLAVGFAMISSYFLSSTLVPVLCVYLLKHKGGSHGKRGLFERLRDVFQKVVEQSVRWRWFVVTGYLVVSALLLWQIGIRLGTELFPQVDSGQFVLRFRPPPGSSYKLTREMALQCLDEIKREAKAENVKITLGFTGQVAPNFGMDNMVLFMRGPDDGYLRVALAEDSGIRLEEFRERLRKELPKRVIPWMARRLETGGLPADEARRQAKMCIFGFQPGDIVTEVMSFGSMTPISVRVVGTNLDNVREHAQKIRAQMERIPYLRDIEFQQMLDYPTVRFDIDREKAGLSGVTVKDAAQPVIEATSSSRFIALNYWIDSTTGFDYQVEVLVPPKYMTSIREIAELPIAQVNPLVNLMIRDVATVTAGKDVGEIDRAASQRYLNINANVEGEDMGRAARQVSKAIAAAGKPPRGVRVMPMGQLPPMIEMFKALGIGLAVAAFVILVLLAAYFQSPRMALVSIGAIPGVLTGVVAALYFTGSTLNIESFMGAIMCLGVSVSNSVMLVTFTGEHWIAGVAAAEAAVIAASERLRPILMTACAMTVGMLPMALGLERGSQMEVPLGRAVIGGLVMSTGVTLLVLPAIFAILIGKSVARSPSLDPDDPSSKHYDPGGHAYVDDSIDPTPTDAKEATEATTSHEAQKTEARPAKEPPGMTSTDQPGPASPPKPETPPTSPQPPAESG
ncbi:MAG: efflux RND transporter permease subunit [Pirellulales bacterium]|nr:efflux RND transporter permease subunit [Pirellulales bacterium]